MRFLRYQIFIKIKFRFISDLYKNLLETTGYIDDKIRIVKVVMYGLEKGACRMRRRLVLFMVMLVLLVTSASCKNSTNAGTDLNEEKTKEKKDAAGRTSMTGEDISAWLQEQTEHSETYLPDLFYCSADKLVIAGSSGVLIYHRKEKKMAYAVDLSDTEFQQFDSDSIHTRVKVSSNGQEMVIYNQLGDERQSAATDGAIGLYQLEAGQSGSQPKLIKLSKALKEDDELFLKIIKENEGTQEDAFDRFSEERGMKDFFTKLENGTAYMSEHAFVWKDDDGGNNSSVFTKVDDEFYLYTKQGKDGEITVEKILWNPAKDVETKLPKPEYQGEDPVEKAVYEYLECDEGVSGCDDTIHIPYMDIYKTVKQNGEMKVYGNFCMMGYYRCSNILKSGCGSVEPGVIHLKKEDGVWKVTKSEFAEDGTEYSKSIKRMCKGYPLIAEKMMNTEFPDAIIKKDLKKYVKKNHLEIDYYQEFGWDLQPL